MNICRRLAAAFSAVCMLSSVRRVSTCGYGLHEFFVATIVSATYVLQTVATCLRVVVLSVDGRAIRLGELSRVRYKIKQEFNKRLGHRCVYRTKTLL